MSVSIVSSLVFVRETPNTRLALSNKRAACSSPSRTHRLVYGISGSAVIARPKCLGKRYWGGIGPAWHDMFLGLAQEPSGHRPLTSIVRGPASRSSPRGPERCSEYTCMCQIKITARRSFVLETRSRNSFLTAENKADGSGRISSVYRSALLVITTTGLLCWAPKNGKALFGMALYIFDVL